jgi:hypothetical protein
MDAGEFSFIISGFLTRRIVVFFDRREKLRQINRFLPVFGIKMKPVPLARPITFYEKLDAVSPRLSSEFPGALGAPGIYRMRFIL